MLKYNCKKNILGTLDRPKQAISGCNLGLWEPVMSMYNYFLTFYRLQNTHINHWLNKYYLPPLKV